MKLQKLNYYDDKIVFKPWGQEHLIYRNGKKLAVWFLRIKKNKSTSLHCHPQKKTGLILLSGKAKIQLGLWEKTAKKYTEKSKLMIRAGLFHKTTNISNDDLLAIELETPVNKHDLVRFEDKYGRKAKPYESGKNIKKIEKYKFKDSLFSLNKKKSILPQKYKINKTNLILEKHQDFKLINKRPFSTIYAILDGKIVDKNNRNIVCCGDIIKTGTLKKLSNNFQIKNYITTLTIF